MFNSESWLHCSFLLSRLSFQLIFDLIKDSEHKCIFLIVYICICVSISTYIFKVSVVVVGIFGQTTRMSYYHIVIFSSYFWSYFIAILKINSLMERKDAFFYLLPVIIKCVFYFLCFFLVILNYALYYTLP